jgi:hypothetical protein
MAAANPHPLPLWVVLDEYLAVNQSATVPEREWAVVECASRTAYYELVVMVQRRAPLPEEEGYATLEDVLCVWTRGLPTTKRQRVRARNNAAAVESAPPLSIPLGHGDPRPLRRSPSRLKPDRGAILDPTFRPRRLASGAGEREAK